MGCAFSKKKQKSKHLQIEQNKILNKKFKVVFLGSAFVGKTSIITTYCNQKKYSSSINPTVGGVYFKKQFKLKNQDVLTMNIWDTAGEQKFRSMASLYYRDADIVVMVFDLGDRDSFHNLEYWINQLDSRIEKEDVTIFVIGNKCDLPKKQISKKQALEWIKTNKNMKYCEVSAKTGQGIPQMFEFVVQSYLAKFGILN